GERRYPRPGAPHPGARRARARGEPDPGAGAAGGRGRLRGGGVRRERQRYAGDRAALSDAVDVADVGARAGQREPRARRGAARAGAGVPLPVAARHGRRVAARDRRRAGLSPAARVLAGAAGGGVAAGRRRGGGAGGGGGGGGAAGARGHAAAGEPRGLVVASARAGRERGAVGVLAPDGRGGVARARADHGRAERAALRAAGGGALRGALAG